ncbi:MAG: chorismate synthase [Planctomycetota bacterium]|jgi:chorismate synthase
MLTYLTAGESHGPQLTAIIDGLPAGLSIELNQVNYQLARRQKGYGRGGRMKIENDQVEILSGLRHGTTLGSPIALVIRNRDWENWSEIMDPIKPLPRELGLKKRRLALETTCPRPGHADLGGGIKWNHHDLRNVLERASARETAARVALGALARQLLEHFHVELASHVVRIGTEKLTGKYSLKDLLRVQEITEASPVRCLNPTAESKMVAAIREARKKRDSLGGVAEIIVRGLPVGLGGFSQWSDRLDGKLAAALMAVHSVKGIEIGLGFEAARKRGSAVHDEIFHDPNGRAGSKKFYRKTNRAGGLEGGITNGEDIILRVASKPISTLNQPLRSVDVKTKQSASAMVERTDNCVVPALAVICESVCALVLAEAFLDKFGSGNLAETERNYQAFLDAPY